VSRNICFLKPCAKLGLFIALSMVMLPNDAASAFEAGRIDAWRRSEAIRLVLRRIHALAWDGPRNQLRIAVLVVAKPRSTILASGSRLADYLKRQARAKRRGAAPIRSLCCPLQEATGVSLDVARVIASRENAN